MISVETDKDIGGGPQEAPSLLNTLPAMFYAGCRASQKERKISRTLE